MNRLSFLLARTLRQETPLAELSAPRADLMAELAGKRIALVGNARALAEQDQGAAIDAADLVIRINRAPIPSARSHGNRTDWLALATTIPAADLARIRPRRILWMSHKRKRLTWPIAASAGFFLFPLADYDRMKGRLGAPPTTGALMIDFLAASGLQSLTLYGFDFFASLSLTGSRTAEQVPHDFGAEKAFVDALIARDGRIALAPR